MYKNNIPERIKEFIFNKIDSVELLEILFVMRDNRTKAWTADTLSAELRSNPSSVMQRLQTLQSYKLIQKSNESEGIYDYKPESDDLDVLIKELHDEYQTRRHAVLELIFSPLKMARDFADAFRLSNSKDDTGDKNG